MVAKSMTGYGRSEIILRDISLIIKVATLNSRTLDINCKIPSQYESMQPTIRNEITNYISRGRVDFIVLLGSSALAKSVDFKNPVFYEKIDQFIQATETINSKYKLVYPATIDIVQLFLSFTEKNNTATINSENYLTESEKLIFQDGIKTALIECDNFRIYEGNGIIKNLITIIDELKSIIEKVQSELPKNLKHHHERIKLNLTKLIKNSLVEVDIQDRIAQEIALNLDKLDINEELQRISSHIEFFLNQMNTSVIGKKLDFITQEMVRECNTMGVKSQSSVIQHLLVNAKSLIEKIKEQTQNIE
jgi:uncharacterized protein (TIGR00255 family)